MAHLGSRLAQQRPTSPLTHPWCCPRSAKRTRRNARAGERAESGEGGSVQDVWRMAFVNAFAKSIKSPARAQRRLILVMSVFMPRSSSAWARVIG